jgi:peroxiredoxin Q/BCP
VFVVNKDGEVLAAEAGGPAATLEVVKRVVEKMKKEEEEEAEAGEKEESKL